MSMPTEMFLREFEQAAPALLAWARLRLRPELRRVLEPEDLIQEVGCRALQRLASYEPAKATLRQWLFGFANLVLMEALRDLARLPANGIRTGRDRSDGFEPAAKVTSVTGKVARNESVRLFLERIEQLDPDDRQLLMHRGLEQLPHPQVAELLAISEDSVRKRWQRLCERMRDDPLFTVLL
jgi:RNA polymerase sigma factor (sigma-70 family)